MLKLTRMLQSVQNIAFLNKTIRHIFGDKDFHYLRDKSVISVLRWINLMKYNSTNLSIKQNINFNIESKKKTSYFGLK